MKKWEYKKLHWISEEELLKKINQEGKEGWKTVSIIIFSITRHYDVYLEREISEPPEYDIRLKAIKKILDERGAYEYHSMIKAIEKIIIADEKEAPIIAKEYCQLHNQKPPLRD